MISLLITLFLMLVAIIIDLFAPRSRSITGGEHPGYILPSASSEAKMRKIEELGSISNIMRTLVDHLAARMSEDLKKNFIPLFQKQYMATEQPPVLDFDQIKHSLKYEAASKVFRTSTHIGQRKLFLSELRFLTEHACNDEIVCVYAGAAPSNHTGLLSKLFPNVKFILVDPNPFDVYDAKPIIHHKQNDGTLEYAAAKLLVINILRHTDKIHIINDYFTMDLARSISEVVPKQQLYFVSDIRTNSNENRAEPDTIDILWNLSQQYNWIKTMNPVQSMLKFRHPFYEEDPHIFEERCGKEPYATDFNISKKFGIDFCATYRTRKLIYFDGAINLQAFPGVSSTETRFITDGSTLKDWGTHYAYEDTLFYYNNIERCYTLHENDNATSELGFDHCNDCAMENWMWKEYLKKSTADISFLGERNVPILVAALSKNTKRDLIRENHGRFFKQRYPLPALIKAVEKYGEDPENKKIYVNFGDRKNFKPKQKPKFKKHPK